MSIRSFTSYMLALCGMVYVISAAFRHDYTFAVCAVVYVLLALFWRIDDVESKNPRS